MVKKEGIGGGGGGDEMRNDGGEVFTAVGVVIL